MARAKSERVGLGVCPGLAIKADKSLGPCGGEVMYRQSLGGLLTHKCDRCDSNGFAQKNGAAYKWRMASITEGEPANEPAPEPITLIKKRPAFSLDAL